MSTSVSGALIGAPQGRHPLEGTDVHYTFEGRVFVRFDGREVKVLREADHPEVNPTAFHQVAMAISRYQLGKSREANAKATESLERSKRSLEESIKKTEECERRCDLFTQRLEEFERTLNSNRIPDVSDDEEEPEAPPAPNPSPVAEPIHAQNAQEDHYKAQQSPNEDRGGGGVCGCLKRALKCFWSGCE